MTTDQPTLAVLKPCPFCGGEAREAIITADNLCIFTVECSVCGAERASDESAEEAQQFWNTRTHSEPRPVAGLREALERIERVMRENIHENDGPDRIWLDGVAHEGPLASWAIRCFRKVGDIARLALSPDPTSLEGGEGWRLVPDGDPVSLNECPPGPFEFNGSLGFKTEYGAAKWLPERDAFTVSHWPDPYCLDSGEAFWGGVSEQAARAALVVQPLSAAHPSTQGV